MTPPLDPARHVVIVGGGVMGAATAWFLAREHGARVTVLERDAGYARASSALSACAIRQQFSTAVNIRLSQASLGFYRTIGRALCVDGDAPDIGLVEPGYLYLAATPDGAEVLREQRELQRSLGVETVHLTREELTERYPWLCADDQVLGSLGVSTPTSGEGWFDGYAVLRAFRRAATAAGAAFVEAEATGFDVQQRAAGNRVSAVRATPVSSGTSAANDDLVIPCDDIMITAGAWSAPLCAMLGVPLPVRARKRDVFAFEASEVAHAAPLVIDPGGVWFRPEVQRGRYLCGAPPRGDDVDDAPLERVDHGLFDEVIWPALAARVPAFDALRVTSAWAGYYEMNTFDHNGLVGALPGFTNAFTACGFSGHGLQQAPAVGRAMAERIATGRYRSLDLSPLCVERVAEDRPLLERNVI